eukprot:4547156-Amphidinium_carterae.1
MAVAILFAHARSCLLLYAHCNLVLGARMHAQQLRFARSVPALCRILGGCLRFCMHAAVVAQSTSARLLTHSSRPVHLGDSVAREGWGWDAHRRSPFHWGGSKVEAARTYSASFESMPIRQMLRVPLLRSMPMSREEDARSSGSMHHGLSKSTVHFVLWARRFRMANSKLLDVLGTHENCFSSDFSSTVLNT